MRFRLDQLDASGLDLELAAEHRRLRLGKVDALRGEATVDGPRFDFTGAGARRIEVESLHLRFGSVLVATDASVIFEELRLAATRDGGTLRGELDATSAFASALTVTAKDLSVTGRVELSGARLRLDGKDGYVVAQQLTLSELVVISGGTRLDITRVEGTHVTVGWGKEGFRLEAGTLRLASAAGTITLPSRPPRHDDGARSHGSGSGGGGGGLPDGILRLLDGLDGHVNVDLDLDITLPVIGTRSATHKFRLPIVDGALDYRTLESGLSRLEDELLDFALRDHALVVEVGLPLLPTRGLGKAIIRWNLGAEDWELAKQQRIRLAMLPRFETSGSSSSDASDRSSKPSRLRELALRDLDASLRLSLANPPAAWPVRRIDELSVAGDLFHDLDAAPRDGRIRGRLVGVDIGATALAAGSQVISLDHAELARITDVDVHFVGLHPRRAQLELHGLAVTALRVGRAPTAT